MAAFSSLWMRLLVLPVSVVTWPGTSNMVNHGRIATWLCICGLIAAVTTIAAIVMNRSHKQYFTLSGAHVSGVLCAVLVSGFIAFAFVPDNPSVEFCERIYRALIAVLPLPALWILSSMQAESKIAASAWWWNTVTSFVGNTSAFLALGMLFSAVLFWLSGPLGQDELFLVIFVPVVGIVVVSSAVAYFILRVIAVWTEKHQRG
jgi:hypothetical protein